MANLLIVESPSKASTIKGYLGSGYKVVASKGHVRDLPKSTLGVDIENDFEPKYINIRGKGDLIKELKKEAKSAGKVFLATDPDREGEAIAWHLANALGIPKEKIKRVTFNEVTKSAIKAAIKNPRDIDMNLVNAQQARRILDRIVGYKLSPYLWKKVKSGLSAGRVQSVAARIIVEREEEIKNFVPVEYWTIEAELLNSEGSKLTAKFYGEGDTKIELTDRDITMKILDEINKDQFVVKSVKKAVRQKNPTPPFTTSTMQQEASKKLGFQSQRIMKVAQELYEGINLGSENGGVHGLITYMRTDSLRISDEAADAAKEYIISKYGKEYYPSARRVYKSKANAQDAHEAIRPSDVTLEPDKIKSRLSNDQYKLYKLIWSRFVASQMASAEIDTVNADINAGRYTFHASGYSIKFRGYKSVYEEADDETAASEKKAKLPKLTAGETLKSSEVTPEQHFTEAPPRYTEASLIKFLEEKGIGRPSTYTPIITTIIARDYVRREGKSLKATALGEVTTRLMVSKFPTIVDYGFTASMEDQLDGVENGTDTLNGILSGFYGDFEASLDKAQKEEDGESFALPVKETDIICEKCGAKMIVKEGRFGKFAACPNYPKCKNTKPLDKPEEKVKDEKEEAPKKKLDELCEKCGAEMVIRNGRFGSFIACSNYPKCRNTKQITKDMGVECPKCKAKIIQKHGKNKTVFYSCERYPDCGFSTWDMPSGEYCPECNSALLIKKGKNMAYCSNESCEYKKDISNKDE